MEIPRDEEAELRAAMCVDSALDRTYGYGRSYPCAEAVSFGAVACREVARAVLQRLVETSDLERLAEAAHEGWACAARNTWDTVKYGRSKHLPPRQTDQGHFTRDNFSHPGGWYQYSRRLQLALMPYANLLPKEQEKDRVAAAAVVKSRE